MFARLSVALEHVQQHLTEYLRPETVLAACRAAGLHWRKRVLDPLTTIHLFVLQVLHGNTAVNHLRHLHPEPFTDSAYCQARARLPLTVLQHLSRGLLTALRPLLDGDDGRWHGHRVFHVDGSGFSMPDAPELQATFGQPGGQAAGCGFPVAHVLALFHAGLGFLLNVFAAPLRTHDLALVPFLHPELEAGDVLVGDRAFCSFAHLALLFGRKLHGVFRVHQRLRVDFRPGRPHSRPGKKGRTGRPSSRWLKRLGPTDQLVEWLKPKARPRWTDAAAFAALPATLVVRELRYRVDRPGFRTRVVTLVTSLVDPEAYPAAALADLYQQRWQVETDLRHLKRTLGMDTLRCETRDGVLKELAVFALVYNLVRLVMCEAARRQREPADRISFVDALRWLRHAGPDTRVPDLVVNPDRTGRCEPRVRKRRPKEFPVLKRPRDQLRKGLKNK